MSKIYLSGSKHSNPVDYATVNKILLDGGHIVETYTGGPFDNTAPDKCDMLVIIPPVNSKSDSEYIYIGRGQYDMVDRANDKGQDSVVYFNGRFYYVEDWDYLGDDWQANYATLSTSNLACFLNDLVRTTAVKIPVIKDNAIAKKSFDLLPAFILFPNRFNK